MYMVYYRCIYREHWYEHAETAYLSMAVMYAQQVEGMGRVARIEDPAGNVIYQTGAANLL